MKRFFSIIALWVLVIMPLRAQYRTPDYSDLYDSETVKALKEHVSFIASAQMEGRLAGSEGEAMTAAYVGKVLASYGLELITPEGGEPFGVVRESGDTLHSRNVAAFIQGVDNSLSDRFIVIGARMDNLGTDTYTVDGEVRRRIYYGANGNASGVALFLELARLLKTNRLSLRRSVLLVAFGASQQTMAGSWYFLNRFFSDTDRIDAMINLDMLGTGNNGFYAYTSSNEDMNMILSILKGELLPMVPELTSMEPYPSDHRAFYDRGIPSVLFTTGRYPEHATEKDTPSLLDYASMEKELEYIYAYAVALGGAPKPAFRPEDAGSHQTARTDAVAFHDCDYKPTFLGSGDPSTFLRKWVYAYLKYPREAVAAGNQGRVVVDFIIDENGNVTDVKVVRGVSEALDAEAVRVISASPKWKPGRVRGKKVRTAMTLTVEFRLEKKDKGGFGINGKRIN